MSKGRARVFLAKIPAELLVNELTMPNEGERVIEALTACYGDDFLGSYAGGGRRG